MSGPRVSERARRVDAFEVMDVVRAARERDDDLTAGMLGGAPTTCHLEVGQPVHRTPAPVLEAARAGLDLPLTYTDGLGLPELRHAISGWYAERHGLGVSASRVAVTNGASAGCVLAFLAVADVGERVAVCEPGYPCYRNVLDALGVEVVTVTVGSDSGYRITPEHLDHAAADGPLAAVVVASPSNPTGTVLHGDDLDALHDWCTINGTTLVVDEIYHGTGASRLPTAAIHDDAVVIQSFSKYFCMTGWRLGWLVLPEAMVRPVERLAQNLYLCPPTLSQRAAIAAFGAAGELDAHAEAYGTNRDTLSAGLRSVGVRDIAPTDGAFYVWADMSRWGTSADLCRRWLAEIGVACTPGTDFDRTRGSQYVRFSVAGSTEEITLATQRLTDWLSGEPN